MSGSGEVVPVGTPALLRVRTKHNGEFTDCDLTCSFTLPSGQVVPAESITHDSTGAYTCQYTPNVSGLYRWEIVCAGAVKRRRPGAFLAM